MTTISFPMFLVTVALSHNSQLIFKFTFLSKIIIKVEAYKQTVLTASVLTTASGRQNISGGGVVITTRSSQSRTTDRARSAASTRHCIPAAAEDVIGSKKVQERKEINIPGIRFAVAAALR